METDETDDFQRGSREEHIAEENQLTEKRRTMPRSQAEICFLTTGGKEKDKKRVHWEVREGKEETSQPTRYFHLHIPTTKRQNFFSF